jgi:hypothetical protein
MKMGWLLMGMLIGCSVLADNGAEYYRKAADSARLISTALPPDFKPYRPPRRVNLSGGLVIVDNFKGDFAALPAQLQAKLKAAWGVEIPIVSGKAAVADGKALLLVGNPWSSDPACRLTTQGFISDNPNGYELRTVSDPMDWRCGAVYLGGRTPERALAAVDAFLEKYPKMPEVIPNLIVCENAKPGSLPDAYVDTMAKGYREGLNNTLAAGMLERVATDYNLTGDDAYAEAFRKMMRLLGDNYYKALDFRQTSPHFRFHIFPAAVDIVEESPVFTDDDQKAAAEIARMISEEVMNNGDMRQPQKLFDTQTREYMTNHPMMAMRSMYFNADFLLRRYDFKPAGYWRDVSVYGMDCVSNFIFSPEDALAYQFHVLEIFTYYAIGSGRFDRAFFEREAMRDYMRYTFAMIDHRGGTSGLGDTYPVQRMISMSGLMRTLRSWVNLLDSRDSQFYLKRVNDFAARYCPGEYEEIDFLPKDLPAPGAASVGLQVFPIRPDKFEALKVENIFVRPALDKVMYRSGWNPDRDEYLYVTGINGGPHGHFDANAISSYVIGDFDWLADRDYIRKYPEDHNSISILCAGKATEWNRVPAELKSFSQLLGSVQRPKRDGAAFSMLVEDYNNINWQRHIAIEAGDGLWVVDELIARKPGDFLAECRWRVLGRPQSGTTGFEFRRVAPDSGKVLATLAISEGSGSAASVHSQFDSGSNAREGGYFGAYAATGGDNTAVLSQRHRRYLQSGEKLFFVNRITSGEAAPVETLGDSLWRVGRGADAALVGVGSLTLGKLQLRAGFFKLDRHGLLAIRASLIHNFKGAVLPLGDGAFSIEELGVTAAELSKWVGIPPGVIRSAPADDDYADQLEPIELARDITALAMCGNEVAAGGADGMFQLRTLDGKLLMEKKFSSSVTAIGAIPGRDGRVDWAIGLHPGSNDPAGWNKGFPPEQSGAVGQVVMLAADGRELWRTGMPYGNVHRAIVRTIFSARFKVDAPTVIVGTTAWMYVSLDVRTGKIMNKFPVLHPATFGAAGDLDGDGIDELGVGCEYYYLRIYNSIAEPLFTTSLYAPYAQTFVAADLDGDARKEFYTGRSDGGMVRLRMDEKGKVRFNTFNLGGPPAGSAVSGKYLYSVSTQGAIARFDGEKVQHLEMLDTPVLAFAGGGEYLAAVGEDGRIYLLDQVGHPHKIYRYSFDPASARPVLAVASEAGAAVASGSKLYLVK